MKEKLNDHLSLTVGEDFIRVTENDYSHTIRMSFDEIEKLYAMAENAKKNQDWFFVINWETREISSKWASLAVASRHARHQGHTGEDNPGLTGYPPIAYVADGNGDCVYNPRFGKKISAAAAGLINAQPSNHF